MVRVLVGSSDITVWSMLLWFSLGGSNELLSERRSIPDATLSKLTLKDAVVFVVELRPNTEAGSAVVVEATVYFSEVVVSW